MRSPSVCGMASVWAGAASPGVGGAGADGDTGLSPTTVRGRAGPGPLQPEHSASRQASPEPRLRQRPTAGRASGKHRDRDGLKGRTSGIRGGERRAVGVCHGEDASGSPRPPDDRPRRCGRPTRAGCTLAPHEEHRTRACDRRMGRAWLPGFGGTRARRRSGDLRRDRSPGRVIVVASSNASITSFRGRDRAIRQDPLDGRVGRPPCSDRPRCRERRQALQDQRGLHPRAGGLLWLHRGRCGPGRGQDACGGLRARAPQPLWRHPVRRDDVPAPELPAARRLRGRRLPPRGSASAASETARRARSRAAGPAREIACSLGAGREPGLKIGRIGRKIGRKIGREDRNGRSEVGPLQGLLDHAHGGVHVQVHGHDQGFGSDHDQVRGY